MHELSVCQALLDQVALIANQHRATNVANITVQIGPLSGVESGLLAQAFPLARAGTIAEAAQLAIEPTPVRVHCDTCGAETDAAVNRLLCGACGDYRTYLVSGDELLLVSVELITSSEQEISRNA